MVLGAPRQRAAAFASALASILTLSIGQAAQAACYGPGQQLPAQVVSRFMNDPARMLTQFPDGGPQMISLIRDLVASDPGALPLIAELNTKANTDQVQSIGTGLGQAALVCARTARAFSDEIQRVTIAANNKPMTQAFGAVMGDQFLGLAGPGVGGGSAEASGQAASTGGASTNSFSLSLTTSVSNIATTSSGFTPSAAASVVPVSSGGAASVGGTAGTANVGTSGGTVVGGTQSGSARPSVSASVSTPSFTANVNSVGNVSTSSFTANVNSLGSVSTPSFTANVNGLRNVSSPNFTASVNSPISVSPTRP